MKLNCWDQRILSHLRPLVLLERLVNLFDAVTEFDAVLPAHGVQAMVHRAAFRSSSLVTSNLNPFLRSPFTSFLSPVHNGQLR